MTRMCCACGHVISGLSGLMGHVPEEFTILPKRLLHEISLKDKNKKINFDAFVDKVYDAGRGVVVCPKCGRHWITQIGGGLEFSHVVEDNYSPSIKINCFFDAIPKMAELKKNLPSLYPCPRENVFLFRCSCSHFIGPAISPAPEEFIFISGALLWRFEPKVEKKLIADSGEGIFFKKIQRECKDIIICPECGRIWMQKNANSYIPYIKEHWPTEDKKSFF